MQMSIINDKFIKCIVVLFSYIHHKTYKFMIFENNEVNKWIQVEVLIFSFLSALGYVLSTWTFLQTFMNL